jgi:hypothetical protein
MSPGSHQDLTRISPGSHRDRTRISPVLLSHQHLTSIAPVSHQYLASSISPVVHLYAVSHQDLTSISPVSHQYLTAWCRRGQLLDTAAQYVTRIAPGSHQDLTSISPVSRQYLTLISPVLLSHQYRASISPVSRQQYLASISPVRSISPVSHQYLSSIIVSHQNLAINKLSQCLTRMNDCVVVRCRRKDGPQGVAHHYPSHWPPVDWHDIMTLLSHPVGLVMHSGATSKAAPAAYEAGRTGVRPTGV